jgi:hypothetical protein
MQLGGGFVGRLFAEAGRDQPGLLGIQLQVMRGYIIIIIIIIMRRGK